MITLHKSAARGVWVVTQNIAGYLPESDPLVYASWSGAAAGIADAMREYADTDDDAVFEAHEHFSDECSPEACVLDSDGPAMRATVDSILLPAECGMVPGQAWDAWVADSIDRRIVFSLAWVRDVADVCIAHDDSHGCCDHCGLWVEQD